MGGVNRGGGYRDGTRWQTGVFYRNGIGVGGGKQGCSIEMV